MAKRKLNGNRISKKFYKEVMAELERKGYKPFSYDQDPETLLLSKQQLKAERRIFVSQTPEKDGYFIFGCSIKTIESAKRAVKEKQEKQFRESQLSLFA